MTIDCPADPVLSRYAIGDLDDASSDEIERHLENCPACADSVARFDSTEDSLMRHLPLAAADVTDATSEQPGWLERLRKGPPEEPASASVPAAAIENRPAQFSSYDLLGVLGRGGMGVVYRARHRQLNRVVALKVLHPRLTATPDARRRFEREIQILGGLHHPGIVMATDANRIDGAAYLVMELIDGIDLARMVRRGGPLTIAEACETGRQMAEALAVAHQAGTIHRDIKPSNVMVDRHGCVKLLDFGLAHFAAISTESLETSLGRLLGTLDYMAPEQAEADRPVDPRADLYSLGATLFYLLAGRPPHGDHSRGSLLQQLRSLAVGDPPRLSSLRADVPPELDEFVARLLSREREKRPDSAQSVAAALSAWAGGDLAARVAEVRADDGGDPASDNGELANRSLSELLQREPAARPAVTPTTVTPPSVARQKGRWTTHRLAWLVGAAAVLGGLLFGVTILLKTPEGTLKIESEADNVAVELVDEREQAKVLQIHVGENESTLRAGKYRVRFSGKHDGISLDQDEFTLQRNQKVVARIRYVKPGAGASKSEQATAGEPLYQGKRESEWQRIFDAETSPVAKLEAAEALLALTAGQPPDAQVKRMLDVGKEIARASFGDDAIDLALADRHRPPLNATRWTFRKPARPWSPLLRGGVRIVPPPVSTANEADRGTEAYRAYDRFQKFLTDELRGIPPLPLAAGLAAALKSGPAPREAFAALLLRGIGRQFIDTDPEAALVVLHELDGPVTGIDWSAVRLVVQSGYLKHASADQRASIVSRLNRLAVLLQEAHPSTTSNLLTDDLLSVLAQSDLPEWPTGLRYRAASLILDRIVRKNEAPQNAAWLTNPGAENSGLIEKAYISQTRKNGKYFLDQWIFVVNAYLAEHCAPPYTEADRKINYSLLKVLPLSQEGDNWPVDKTASLLSDQLRVYYTADVKDTTDKSVDDLLPVEPATLLIEIVSIDGQIPDFVRTGHPKAAAVAARMQQFESAVRNRETSLQQFQTDSASPFSELISQDPYEVVKLAVEPGDQTRIPYAVLTATSTGIGTVWNDFGRAYPIDRLLLLALAADLTGQNSAQDERIAALLTDGSPASFLQSRQTPLHRLLSSPLKKATVARGLLKMMAKAAKSPALINIIHILDPALAPAAVAPKGESTPTPAE